ncbi:NTP pyrophosphohydrolase [Halobacteriales archaeon QS_8_69_26]|nr:MAG: NTP pyrophosphohydrolase [Halobacteriales archaeon QS_8_69_26]
MPEDHYHRETVECRLERLRGEYGEFPVFEEVEMLEPDRFETVRAEFEDGHSGAGYAWVVREPADAPPVAESMPDSNTTERPQVLLILHRGDDRAWSVVGGGREGDETYEAATVREVREETGIEVDLGAPFAAHRGIFRSADDAVDAVLHGLWVSFDATYAGGSLAIQPGELRGAAWFADPPEDLGYWSQYRGREWWDDYEPAERWWEEFDRRDDG